MLSNSGGKIISLPSGEKQKQAFPAIPVLDDVIERNRNSEYAPLLCKIRELASHRLAILDEIEQMERRVDELSHRSCELETNHERFTKSIKLGEQLLSLYNRKTKLQEDADRISKEIGTLSAKIREGNKRIREAKKRIDGLNCIPHDVANRNEKLKAKLAEKEQLEKDVAELRKTVPSAVAEKGKLKEELNGLRKQLKEISCESESAEHELVCLNPHLKGLKINRELVSSLVETFKEKLSLPKEHCAIETARLRGELKEKQSELNCVENELEQLIRKCAVDFSASWERLKCDVERIYAEMPMLTQQLSMQINKLKRAEELFKERLAKDHIFMDALENDIKSTETQLKRIIKEGLVLYITNFSNHAVYGDVPLNGFPDYLKKYLENGLENAVNVEGGVYAECRIRIYKDTIGAICELCNALKYYSDNNNNQLANGNPHLTPERIKVIKNHLKEIADIIDSDIKVANQVLDNYSKLSRLASGLGPELRQKEYAIDKFEAIITHISAQANSLKYVEERKKRFDNEYEKISFEQRQTDKNALKRLEQIHSWFTELHKEVKEILSTTSEEKLRPFNETLLVNLVEKHT